MAEIAESPLRRRVTQMGWGLMILSALLWVVIPVLPFLPYSVKERVAAAAAILVVAEILFWGGAAMAGADAARRMRSWWRRADTQPKSDSASTSDSRKDPDPEQEIKS